MHFGWVIVCKHARDCIDLAPSHTHGDLAGPSEPDGRAHGEPRLRSGVGDIGQRGPPDGALFFFFLAACCVTLLSHYDLQIVSLHLADSVAAVATSSLYGLPQAEGASDWPCLSLLLTRADITDTHPHTYTNTHAYVHVYKAACLTCPGPGQRAEPPPRSCYPAIK
jgi:hypothetical protein